MLSWAQGCTGDEDKFFIKAVIGEGVNVEEVIVVEAPHPVRKVRENVLAEGTLGCC